MYNTGVSGSTGGQRTGSDALRLELKIAANHLVVAVWKLNLRSLQKQKMLSSLQPQTNTFKEAYQEGIALMYSSGYFINYDLIKYIHPDYITSYV